MFLAIWCIDCKTCGKLNKFLRSNNLYNDIVKIVIILENVWIWIKIIPKNLLPSQHRIIWRRKTMHKKRKYRMTNYLLAINMIIVVQAIYANIRWMYVYHSFFRVFVHNESWLIIRDLNRCYRTRMSITFFFQICCLKKPINLISCLSVVADENIDSIV